MKQKISQANLKFIQASHVREKQIISIYFFWIIDMQTENENYLSV